MSRIEPIAAPAAAGPVVVAAAPSEPAADQVNILERIWFAIVAHYLAIIGIVAGFVLLGLVVTLLQQPQFTAMSRIQINPEQDKVTNVESLDADMPGDTLEFYQTQYSLLEARSLAERVARLLKLPTDPKFFDMYGVDPEGEGASPSEGTARATLNSAERNRRLAIATDILLKNVTIDPIRRSSLIDIQFTSPDPVFSATVANAWVDQFIQQTLDRRFESTGEARKFLESRLAGLRGKLEQSERDLIGYAADRQIVTLQSTQDPEGRTVTQKTLVAADLEALNNELVRARAERIDAQSRLGGQNTRDQAISSTLGQLRQQRAQVAADRARLLSQFESGYPQVEALTAQLANIDQSIDREQGRVGSEAQENYREALARENALSAQVAALRTGFQNQRRDSIQYQIYQREVDTNRELYDGLLQRYKEIGVAGVSTNNIAVIDRAEVPRTQSSPKTALNMFMALIFGLFFAGLYVLLREQIDQTIKDPRNVTATLGLAHLGSIPASSEEDLLNDAMDRKSEVYEAYAAASTNLGFLTSQGVPRSLLLTSTRPNEGKSTSAYAIANILSNQGKRILLVDGDLRNPSLEEFLGISSDIGLTHYLSGDERLDQMIIRPDGFKLDFLPAGKIAPNPTELLANPRLSELMRRLEDKYDHVVVDGPPILGLADVPLLGAAVEGVVLVVRANGSKVRAIKSSIARVQDTGAHIFGAVVTMLDQRNAAYAYGDGYGYGYGYGRRNEADAERALG